MIMLKPKQRVKITSQKHCCNKDLLWSNENKAGNRIAVCQLCRKGFFRAGESNETTR